MSDIKPELVKIGEYAGYWEVDRKTFAEAIEKKSVREAVSDGREIPTRYYIR